MDIQTEFEGEKIKRAEYLRQIIERGELNREGIANLIRTKNSDFSSVDLSFLADRLHLEDPNHPLLKELRGAGVILSELPS